MRDYLNAKEGEDVVLTLSIYDSAKTMLKNMESRGNLTKDEKKFLKYSLTYMRKFSDALFERLNTRTAKKMLNQIKDMDLFMVDSMTAKKMNNDIQDKMKVARLEREQFEDFCIQIMSVKCQNCKKKHSTCELHDLFYENYVSESGWDMKNCRYAYSLNDKKVKKIKEKVSMKERKQKAN